MSNVDYYPESINSGGGVKKQEKARKKVKKKTSALVKAKLISLISMFFILFGSILYLLGYANISKMQIEVSKLEGYKNTLVKSKTDLTAELEGLKSSKDISEDALYKLGMTYPKDKQVVHISVSDEINIEKLKSNEKKENNFDKFKRMILDLF